ncbi:unnamed protein product [Amoebophrya sp. A120]|nr:unnamed protein product [Amoebophrya sp. A120]|eukprot:GSA120T00018156001.1
MGNQFGCSGRGDVATEAEEKSNVPGEDTKPKQEQPTIDFDSLSREGARRVFINKLLGITPPKARSEDPRRVAHAAKRSTSAASASTAEPGSRGSSLSFEDAVPPSAPYTQQGQLPSQKQVERAQAQELEELWDACIGGFGNNEMKSYDAETKDKATLLSKIFPSSYFRQAYLLGLSHHFSNSNRIKKRTHPLLQVGDLSPSPNSDRAVHGHPQPGGDKGAVDDAGIDVEDKVAPSSPRPEQDDKWRNNLRDLWLKAAHADYYSKEVYPC